jgi:hydroxymethylpyrimidine kinase/phosphomethylpyrimidine kinase
MGVLFDDFQVAAIKTGMLPTVEVIEEVAAAIKAQNVQHLVVDPVVRSTSGYDLIDDRALAALISLMFPIASVVTPNAAEAERITGMRVEDEDSMRRVAERVLAYGASAVLVKGGDINSRSATDILLDAEGFTRFESERIQSTSTHGTGCTLSAALACLLAHGRSLGEAVPIAKQYICDAITSAPGLGLGHGPLNHFAQFPQKRNKL